MWFRRRRRPCETSGAGVVKGVILAGGTGSRLHPLTRITNKHLLPINDRPMVSFAIEALVRAGISELMLVTGGTHAGEFFRLLGNGHEHGIDKLLYAYQEKPGGIAEALGLAERFVDRDRVCVMLADNILERSFRPSAERFAVQERGSRGSSRSRSCPRASTRSPGSTSTTRPSGTCCPRWCRPVAASSRSPM